MVTEWSLSRAISMPFRKKVKSKFEGKRRPSFSMWLNQRVIRFMVVQRERES